jgi:imidazolonepropionase-like amidohydrolase
VVEDDDQIANVIARQLERRVEWIKVMATGGVFTEGSRSSDTQFSLEQLEKIVGIAREHGRSVAAHCHGTHGIEVAARSGVRTIEHCSFAGSDGFGTDLDPRVVDLLVEAGAWVSPTVNVGWMRRLHAAEDRGDDPNELPFFQRMSRALRALRDAGVRFVASTDAGIPGVAHDRLAEGLVGLRRYVGLEAIDVLRAATSNAALALGIEDETGSLLPGLSADIVVVDEDPTRNLATLKKPRAVIARGELAERPDDPATSEHS